MKMSKNLRYLFIGALWLLSNYTTYTVAQNRGVTLKDLPPCAEPCADTAAAAVGCDTEDNSCLCSHKNFSTATLQCSRDCRPDSLALTRQILTEMCANASTTGTSTTTSSTSTSSTTQSTTTSTTSTFTSSTSQSSSTSTTLSTTVTTRIPSTSLSQDTTQSGSSTVVVIQTVVVAQPSTIPNAAGRLDIGSASIALGALIFSLPPLIMVVTAI